MTRLTSRSHPQWRAATVFLSMLLVWSGSVWAAGASSTSLPPASPGDSNELLTLGVFELTHAESVKSSPDRGWRLLIEAAQQGNGSAGEALVRGLTQRFVRFEGALGNMPPPRDETSFARSLIAAASEAPPSTRRHLATGVFLIHALGLGVPQCVMCGWALLANPDTVPGPSPSTDLSAKSVAASSTLALRFIDEVENCHGAPTSLKTLFGQVRALSNARGPLFISLLDQIAKSEQPAFAQVDLDRRALLGGAVFRPDFCTKVTPVAGRNSPPPTSPDP